MDSVQHNTPVSAATTTKVNDKKKGNKPTPISPSTKKASPLSIAPISQNKLNQPPADQSGWYIQVGVFAKQSSINNAIKKIKNSGFDYIVFPDMIREQTVSRILVGPYQSLESAKKDIKQVQFEIEKNAYFYHIK
ncbi:SPOR domain-containing protein [uncultured Shewanella sp.]|uniref:SPOR domain-containing protein n=1 Tax=uncultured Shewanella sp. TaxID=173975 RepID=UPI002615DB39|nr:SPOR domain-containing protein [uncultured Shewanella sp.]